MIYAVSDIHGMYEKYQKLLSKIEFSDSDTLFVLGDVVDRGPDGIKVLQDMRNRTNIIPLLGNHDYTAYLTLNAYITNPEIMQNEKYADALKLWMRDGGLPTVKSFLALNTNDKNDVLEYINSFQLHYDISVNGREFLLAHTVPEKELLLSKRMKNSYYYLGEPDYDVKYFEDKFIVTGHTPTFLIEEIYNGKIYKGNGHIAIDCGAAFGRPLACICLDNLEETYVD